MILGKIGIFLPSLFYHIKNRLSTILSTVCETHLGESSLFYMIIFKEELDCKIYNMFYKQIKILYYLGNKEVEAYKTNNKKFDIM